MKHKTQTLIPISLLLGLFLVFTPFSTLSAQDDDDSVEEIFWGDEEEDAGLDEEFDFSEDEEFGDEFSDDEFAEDEGDESFSEDFEEPEETVSEAASKMGYTLNLIGSSPGFVNHQLRTYNSGMDFRATFEFPMLLEMGPFRFRLGAEVGTFKFTNYKPIGGTYSGVHITGILSFPAGPGQVRLGGGMIGKGFGVIAENSYGMTIGNALDLRIGLRSTTAFGIKDSAKNSLGTVSWMDGIIAIGVNL
ncbi:MAG: hypothetical protein ISR82_07995 [Candidatus Marinimicrobia bacterium]|nr:hypothetical protein [Candidatus Neomarinimicrobiota bacterium]MBL7011147.1 hypothetical protein [Candidatus Neomarinimicrobiota bacterium]MBL7031504.1 hypothetical protein [Candidatus Neomarinimicrobiota bacterium]